jgi:phosphoglycolate phosphatase-like HAD superfamily hydrolase
MLDAIIFDYDGTIAPTLKRQYNWFHFWAGKNGKEISFKEFSQEFMDFYNKHCAIEGGVQNVYDALQLPCDMKDKAHPVWPAYEEFKNLNPVMLYDGMAETIEAVWKMGQLSDDSRRCKRLRLCINTTNTWSSIFRELKSCNVLHYFDCFVTEEVLKEYMGAGNQDAIKKPSKISIALSTGLLGASVGTVLHIGDTVNDLIASQSVSLLPSEQKARIITRCIRL